MASNKTKAHNEAFERGVKAFNAGQPISSGVNERSQAAFVDGWHSAAADASVRKIMTPKPAAPTMNELTKLGMLRELILTKQAYEHAYREFVTGIGRGASKPLNTEQVRTLETTVARAAQCGMARDIDLEELAELLNAIGA